MWATQRVVLLVRLVVSRYKCDKRHTYNTLYDIAWTAQWHEDSGQPISWQKLTVAAAPRPVKKRTILLTSIMVVVGPASAGGVSTLVTVRSQTKQNNNFRVLCFVSTRHYKIVRTGQPQPL